MSFGHPIADFEHPNIYIFCVLCIGMKMNWTPNSPQMFVCLFVCLFVFFFLGGGLQSQQNCPNLLLILIALVPHYIAACMEL